MVQIPPGPLQGSLPADQACGGLLLEIFSTSKTHSLYGGEMRNDAALMRDLLAFGCSNSHAPITQADLSKNLLKSTSSMNKASSDHFGLTPMQMQ